MSATDDAPVDPKANRRRGGRVARVLSGIAHAAVLGLLGLPFVGFWAGCSSPIGGDVTGYQALAGFTIPHVDVQYFSLYGLQVDSLPSFGPNLWIGLLIVVAVAGVAMAWVGGPKATAARLVSGSVGIFVAWAAIALAYPATFDVQGVSVTTENDPGGQQAIFAVLGIALVGDALSILLWWSRKSTRSPAGQS